MPYNLPSSYAVPTRPVKHQQPITIIILGANISHGMKSYGPKTLLTINNQTFLEYQVSTIRQVFPQSDIILVVGFMADRIIKKRPDQIRIIENQFFQVTNEIEQLRLAFNCTLTDDVLILKDNIIFNTDTLKNVVSNESCIIYDSNNQIDPTDVGVTIVNDYGTFFSYDISTKWCHIVYLKNKELRIIKNICNNRNNSKFFLFEALNMILNKTEKIKAIQPINMEITKIDNSRDFFRLKENNSNENFNC
jgi:choline kinase